jgi:hypothetical protein
LRNLIFFLLLIANEATNYVSVMAWARRKKLVHDVDNAVQRYTVGKFDLVAIDMNGRFVVVETAVLLPMAGIGELLLLGLPVQGMVWKSCIQDRVERRDGLAMRMTLLLFFEVIVLVIVFVATGAAGALLDVVSTRQLPF